MDPVLRRCNAQTHCGQIVWWLWPFVFLLACLQAISNKKNVNHKLQITATARYGKSPGMVIQLGASRRKCDLIGACKKTNSKKCNSSPPQCYSSSLRRSDYSQVDSRHDGCPATLLLRMLSYSGVAIAGTLSLLLFCLCSTAYSTPMWIT